MTFISHACDGYQLESINYLCFMIFTILESRLIDILLIGAALYFIFPSVFKRKTVRRESPNTQQQRTTINYQNAPREDNKKGEYIDYEEIK